ncbi:hypothetical protein OKW30_006042 [Paraburkholderia sp. Clong3]|uniref:hypothetical protein n=1 Tax=Paraburkholderia sp. Clong3 TaxID=2991061 RepID=UPI003D258D9B
MGEKKSTAHFVQAALKSSATVSIGEIRQLQEQVVHLHRCETLVRDIAAPTQLQERLHANMFDTDLRSPFDDSRERITVTLRDSGDYRYGNLSRNEALYPEFRLLE